MEPSADNGASRTGFSTARPVGSFFETAREVVLRPASFYRGLDMRQPSKNPVVFAVVCGTVPALLALLLAPFDPLAPDQPNFVRRFISFAGNNPGAAVAIVVAALVLSPLLALLGLYVGALVQHLFVMIFVRRRREFEATLRVQAYSSALSLVGWIPVVGYPVTLHGAYVRILGIRELHGASTLRASLAVLVPMLFWLLSLLLPFFLPQPGVSPNP